MGNKVFPVTLSPPHLHPISPSHLPLSSKLICPRIFLLANIKILVTHLPLSVTAVFLTFTWWLLIRVRKWFAEPLGFSLYLASVISMFGAIANLSILYLCFTL